MKKRFRVIFMGTPDFAVPVLNALHINKQDVALVVTQPDRPKGRGKKFLPPPVKTEAQKLGYEIVQPGSIRTEEFYNLVKNINPDIIVVVAFGHILPENILESPRLATLNIHASLLPKYRGPAPIQWAIINCEKETGVTLMLMDQGLDTGDILLDSKIEISPDDTAGSLHDRLSDLGANLLIRALESFENGDINAFPQDPSMASYAPLLNKKDGHIDWNKPAEILEAFIRGMNPWPGAFTFHGKKRLKIFKAVPGTSDVDLLPGSVIKGFADELRIATGKGALSILEIQAASGKRLPVKDFLMGYNLPVGSILT